MIPDKPGSLIQGVEGIQAGRAGIHGNQNEVIPDLAFDNMIGFCDCPFHQYALYPAVKIAVDTIGFEGVSQ